MVTEAPTKASLGSGDRADAVAERFTVPVILAALASVPAMFLTALEGRPAQVGTVVNYASLAVFAAEAVVLFVLAGDRRRWLRQHAFLVVVAAATIPAVVFAVGPVQVLRLVRFVGALRVLRVRRIFRAGRILRHRAGLDGPVATVIAVAVTVLAAAFVAIVLADPTSDTRRLVDGALERFGVLPTLIAGGLLAVSTVVVWRARRGDASEAAEQRQAGTARSDGRLQEDDETGRGRRAMLGPSGRRMGRWPSTAPDEHRSHSEEQWD